MHFIRDKHRRKYLVTRSDSNFFTRFNIVYCGIRVGHVNCRFEGDEVLRLIDLCIRDTATLPPWFYLNFCNVSFPPTSWRTENYRNRGLGTAMIEFLVTHAKSKRAKRIEGEVKTYDFKANPDLPDWYRRRGFEVIMGDKNPGWVARISRAI